MAYVYLIRHGIRKHTAKKPKTIPGNGLTLIGIIQSYLTGIYLKKFEKIDLIYCSKMKRSIDTAKIISKKVNVSIKEESKLCEFNKQLFFDVDNYSKLSSLDSFFDEILCANKNIVIVGHGNVFRFLIGRMNKLNLDKMPEIKQEHCSITKIYVDGKKPQIISQASIKHIPKFLRTF